MATDTCSIFSEFEKNQNELDSLGLLSNVCINQQKCFIILCILCKRLCKFYIPVLAWTLNVFHYIKLNYPSWHAIASSISLMNDSRGLKIAVKFEQNKVHVNAIQILFKKKLIHFTSQVFSIENYFWYKFVCA